MVTVTGVSPVRLTVTGILTVCSVSSPFHVKPVGVPVTLPLVPSIVKPFVGVGVTVVPGLFGLMTFSLLVYGCPSTAGFVGVTFPAVKPSFTRGAGSWSFGIPSPSISSSDTSGLPSPSKSLCTTTGIVTVTGVSPVRVTVTGIFTVLDVSSPVHSIPVGFPVTFPSVPTVNPFVGVAVNVASSLFGLITFSLLV